MIPTYAREPFLTVPKQLGLPLLCAYKVPVALTWARLTLGTGALAPLPAGSIPSVCNGETLPCLRTGAAGFGSCLWCSVTLGNTPGLPSSDHIVTAGIYGACPVYQVLSKCLTCANSFDSHSSPMRQCFPISPG